MPVFEHQTLDNGLRLLTAPMPQVPSTTCFVFLAAGSRYETPQTNGIALSRPMFRLPFTPVALISVGIQKVRPYCPITKAK